jgi:hypothetical protein
MNASDVEPRGRGLADPSAAATMVLLTLALLLVTGAVAATALYGVRQPATAVAFGVFVAIGVALRQVLIGDREAWPIATAGALAYVMVPDYGGQTTDYRGFQVLAVVAVATLVGSLPLLAAGRAPSMDLVAREWITVAAAAILIRPILNSGAGDDLPPWIQALLLLVLSAAVMLLSAVLAALVRSSRTRSPFPRALRDELAATRVLSVAIVATAALIALSSGVMAGWALVVFGVQMALVQVAFNRYATIRSTYRQTIRALSRVTEIGGYTEIGHARRVAAISVAIGREMGLSESELLDLEFAALLHDIGQLSLATPIPGGATVVASAEDSTAIARKGAQVIEQTGVLDDVATIVRRMPDPYRKPHEFRAGEVPLASRIVKVANDYDDLVGGSRDSARCFAALERLRLSTARDHDPLVVEQLSRMVERATLLGV